jgi:hypothetical protein
MHDIDGSLTETGSEVWLTKFYPHLDNTTSCTKNMDSTTYGNEIVICESVIRKVNIFNLNPFDLQ